MGRGMGFAGTILLIGLTASGEGAGIGGAGTVSPLALSPAERSAVVADSDGALHLVRAGEPLPGGAGLLVEVLADRLVVELPAGPPAEAGEGGAGGRSTPLRAWIYPPERPGMPARVQELDPRPPAGLPAELLTVPATVPDQPPPGARIARPPAPPEAADDPAAPLESDAPAGAPTAGDSSTSASVPAAPGRGAAAGNDA
jgi:hypothetical protein